MYNSYTLKKLMKSYDDYIQSYEDNIWALFGFAERQTDEDEDMFDYYFERAIQSIQKMMKYEEIKEALSERYDTANAESR